MKNNGVLDLLGEAFIDRRRHNKLIPMPLILALSITAKMKIKSSLSDIPYAITDHNTLSVLGYNLGDNDSLEKGLLTEGSLRHLIGMYDYFEMFNSYNTAVQKYIMPKLNINPTIHILDCTKVYVNPNNKNYEFTGRISEDGEYVQGYKLATLRGITEDTGIIEHVAFWPMNLSDILSSTDILLRSPVLKPGDILINDRGFISRDMLNRLKSERGVDTYVPLRKNMDAYEAAVSAAKFQNKWSPHPKRSKQKIAFIPQLEDFWSSDNPAYDVPINSCVVWNTETNQYSVFVTTDTSKSSNQIIMTYELRPEIEEDYRQLKDFWRLEDFKSTKVCTISFHIVCVLLGYLFFQLYTMTSEGDRFSGKSLPVVLKNYVPKTRSAIIIYNWFYEFAILTLLETMKLYADCDIGVRSKLDEILKDV